MANNINNILSKNILRGIPYTQMQGYMIEFSFHYKINFFFLIYKASKNNSRRILVGSVLPY